MLGSVANICDSENGWGREGCARGLTFVLTSGSLFLWGSVLFDSFAVGRLALGALESS